MATTCCGSSPKPQRLEGAAKSRLDLTAHRRDDGWMTTYLWPGDTGWPTPEEDDLEPLDQADLDAETDFDVLALHAPPPHLYDDLTEIERFVLGARFGLAGAPVRSMKELHSELDLSRQELRVLLASALGKLRERLVD